jgi:hypothetical protein
MRCPITTPHPGHRREGRLSSEPARVWQAVSSPKRVGHWQSRIYGRTHARRDRVGPQKTATYPAVAHHGPPGQRVEAWWRGAAVFTDREVPNTAGWHDAGLAKRQTLAADAPPRSGGARRDRRHHRQRRQSRHRRAAAERDASAGAIWQSMVAAQPDVWSRMGPRTVRIANCDRSKNRGADIGNYAIEA